MTGGAPPPPTEVTFKPYEMTVSDVYFLQPNDND